MSAVHRVWFADKASGKRHGVVVSSPPDLSKHQSTGSPPWNGPDANPPHHLQSLPGGKLLASWFLAETKEGRRRSTHKLLRGATWAVLDGWDIWSPTDSTLHIYPNLKDFSDPKGIPEERFPWNGIRERPEELSRNNTPLEISPAVVAIASGSHLWFLAQGAHTKHLCFDSLIQSVTRLEDGRGFAVWCVSDGQGGRPGRIYLCRPQKEFRDGGAVSWKRFGGAVPRKPGRKEEPPSVLLCPTFLRPPVWDSIVSVGPNTLWFGQNYLSERLRELNLRTGEFSWKTAAVVPSSSSGFVLIRACGTGLLWHHPVDQTYEWTTNPAGFELFATLSSGLLVGCCAGLTHTLACYNPRTGGVQRFSTDRCWKWCGSLEEGSFGGNGVLISSPHHFFHSGVVAVEFFNRAESLVHNCCVVVATHLVFGEFFFRTLLPTDLAETCRKLRARRCLVVSV